MCRQSAPGVRGIEGHGLGAKRLAARGAQVRRHQPQVPVEGSDLQRLSHRLENGAGGECPQGVFHQGNDLLQREQGADLGLAQNQHRGMFT